MNNQVFKLIALSLTLLFLFACTIKIQDGSKKTSSNDIEESGQDNVKMQGSPEGIAEKPTSETPFRGSSTYLDEDSISQESDDSNEISDEDVLEEP